MTTTLLSWQALQLNSAQNTVLLQSSSATINNGDIIVIQGRSGSGKSLLLRCLNYLEKFQCQSLKLQNVSYQALTPMQWRQRVALVGQQAMMVTGTVEDNLRLPFSFRSHKRSYYSATWHQEHLALFNKNSDFIKRNINQLSGGEKQIVNLLRTLQLNPLLLLLDEPTAALDEHNRDIMQTLLLSWVNNASARAIVWISHDKHQRAIGKRHWQMQDGGNLILDKENFDA